MTEHAASNESRVPLVLRQIPDERIAVAAALLGRPPGQLGEIWWELVDVADDLDAQAPAVVVVVGELDGVQELSLVTVRTRDAEDHDALSSAVTQLIAVMRSTPARLLRAAPADATTRALLLQVGFSLSTTGSLVLEL